MNDVYFIKEIIKEIEKKLNWESISLWTDNEYRNLSQLILEDTNISISAQTLKRLFGKVKYKNIYTPQSATKDALAMFLGYKDWLSFVQTKNNKTGFYFRHSDKWNINSSYKRILILGGVAVLFIIIILTVHFHSIDESTVFYADNLSGTVPYTVSINYDISKIKNQEIYIDFDEHEAEDSTLIEKLDKSRHLINHCFETPGFYTIRLWIDGKIYSSIKVHVLSDGWTSYYFNNDNFAQRKFVLPLENKVMDQNNDSLLYLSPADLTKQGFKSNTVYYLENMLYKDFGLSADNSEMEVKYKNSPENGGISCYDVEFRIIGENGLVSVMFVQRGCHRWSEVTVGDVLLNGKYNDLTNLSSDMASWNIIKIQLNENKARFINGQDTIFSCLYKKPLGSIKGIRFVTKGSGAFDYVRLFNSNGDLKYEDNFEK
ncbi:hypothetical protein AQPE_2759 [Aquipluma nitroreducens]|uniref:Uncharacterized protein n=1 Tax=Aquipluma nitroreducens TaxID=2010828 RepID=A0A5K7SAV7_9BACT|nr:hypothetical protein [Aquipluma nitroreducens]BBE18596.1 hypothetical protein AQPE_2759 [Aquipluma nitroreducens]